MRGSVNCKLRAIKKPPVHVTRRQEASRLFSKFAGIGKGLLEGRGLVDACQSEFVGVSEYFREIISGFYAGIDKAPALKQTLAYARKLRKKS